MKTISYHTVQDKATWGDGPWVQEPDKIQWQDRKTNLPCLVVRNRFGALCGYVGVSEDHSTFGKDYGDLQFSVHGGLTFSGFCQSYGDEHSKGVCHISSEGESDRIWWLGFDCAHGMDVCPAYKEHYSLPGHYRDLNYVKREVRSLAKQLYSMKDKAKSCINLK